MVGHGAPVHPDRRLGAPRGGAESRDEEGGQQREAAGSHCGGYLKAVIFGGLGGGFVDRNWIFGVGLGGVGETTEKRMERRGSR